MEHREKHNSLRPVRRPERDHGGPRTGHADLDELHDGSSALLPLQFDLDVKDVPHGGAPYLTRHGGVQRRRFPLVLGQRGVPPAARICRPDNRSDMAARCSRQARSDAASRTRRSRSRISRSPSWASRLS